MNQSRGRNYYLLFITLDSPLQLIYPGDKILSPLFLTTEDRTMSDNEQFELEARPAAPNWLGQRALDWALLTFDNRHVLEGRDLVGRARRLGYADSSREIRSQAISDLLHERDPDSERAKKIPNWFNPSQAA